MAVCPFADQRYRYDGAYPSSGYSGGPSKGLLHTTEGGLPGTLQAYGGGAKAPHFTVNPITSARRVDIFQHFDTARPSRALANAAGGVQTNGDGVVQIELVGTCAIGGPGMFWPGAPQWALDGLARLMRWIEADRGIPRRSALVWLPYPESYGASRARMTQAQWDAFAGWCGHQHAAENLHGDPGVLPIAYLLGEDEDLDANQNRLLVEAHGALARMEATVLPAILAAAKDDAQVVIDPKVIADAILAAGVGQAVADELAKRLGGQ